MGMNIFCSFLVVNHENAMKIYHLKFQEILELEFVTPCTVCLLCNAAGLISLYLLSVEVHRTKPARTRAHWDLIPCKLTNW